MQGITPFLWYTNEAERGWPRSMRRSFRTRRVERVTAMPSETPSGPAGSVKVVEFVLFGQSFTGDERGAARPVQPRRVVHRQLRRPGRDRPLLERAVARRWQGRAMRLAEGPLRLVVGRSCRPRCPTMMSDADRVKAKRAADAMMKMVKIDIAALQAAFDGLAPERQVAGAWPPMCKHIDDGVVLVRLSSAALSSNREPPRRGVWLDTLVGGLPCRVRPHRLVATVFTPCKAICATGCRPRNRAVNLALTSM